MIPRNRTRICQKKNFWRAKSNYNGITKKGIEAIALKYQGYSNAEIANLYHVKANHISAWISRARSRLKADYPLTDLCYS